MDKGERRTKPRQRSPLPAPGASQSGIDGYDQLYAARVLERLDRQHKFVEAEVATHSRWLTASLFAANSAGLIGIANGKLGEDGFLPGLMFVIGVGASLLSGNALQEIYNNYSVHLHDLDEYWTNVKIGTPRDFEAEATKKVAIRRASRWNWIAPMLGWVSGLLFLAGAVVGGLAMTKEKVPAPTPPSSVGLETGSPVTAPRPTPPAAIGHNPPHAAPPGRL